MLMKIMEPIKETKKPEHPIVDCMTNMDYVLNVCTDMVFSGILKLPKLLSITKLLLDNGHVLEIA